MNKIIFSGVALFGLTIYSYAELPEVIAGKVADILTAKINADKDVAIEALKNASTITIDGDVYFYTILSERMVVIKDGNYSTSACPPSIPPIYLGESNDSVTSIVKKGIVYYGPYAGGIWFCPDKR